MKQFVLMLCLALLVSSCGSKKKVSVSKVKDKSGRVVLSQKPDFKRGETHPLPKDNGKFKRFEIGSVEEYIATFAPFAQQEMELYGIPASITLAQGILESGFGRSELARKTNNHFGIKCHTGWQGQFDFHDDDRKGEC